MAGKRSYDDRCGVARALDLIGERWAMLVVRELLLGPKRFTDLRTGLPHVGPDVLSLRLRELEQAGILRRATLPPPAGSRVYELTDRGRELEPVILALGRWGSRAPLPTAAGAELSVDAFAVALLTLFDSGAADGVDASYALSIGGQPFHARVSDGQLMLVRGVAEAPDAAIVGEPGALAAVLWHGEDIADGRVAVDGDLDAVRRLLRLFPAP